jgi:LysR family transcriptional activator of nhaA
MKWLNYQHLYYFWTVARIGTVTEAAQQLHLAQPTLSAQLKLLEHQLQSQLFEKRGRRLQLTVAGKVAFDFAEKIFTLGSNLVDQLETGRFSQQSIFKVGISDVVPKMLAYRILKPLYMLPDVPKLLCLENNANRLLAALSVREIDLVISDSPVPSNIQTKLFSHSLGTCSVSLLATRKLANQLRIKKPKDLSLAPLLLPSKASALRQNLEYWLASHDIPENIVGDFQDSALMKIFGKEGQGVFPVPQTIEREVCRDLKVTVVLRIPIQQTYYLIATEKRLSTPIIAHLYQSARAELF